MRPKKIPNQINIRIRRLKSKTRREFPASRSATFCSRVLHIFEESDALAIANGYIFTSGFAIVRFLAIPDAFKRVRSSVVTALRVVSSI